MAGTIGSIFTVAVLIFFIAVVLWTFNKRNKDGFEKAANLVFEDEQKQATDKQRESSGNE